MCRGHTLFAEKFFCMAKQRILIVDDEEDICMILSYSLQKAGYETFIALTNQDPANLYFSISDNGSGIPDEALAHIFERFYRVDKGRSRKVGGTSLGLSIVKHAVIFHGGNITAQNRSDGGLEFIFSLARRSS